MNREKLAEAFKALSDARRLRALRYIAERDSRAQGCGESVCACHVQEHLGLSQPATSYHMKVLGQAGLVTSEKRGRWVHYRVSKEGIERLRSFLSEIRQAVPAADADSTSDGEPTSDAEPSVDAGPTPETASTSDAEATPDAAAAPAAGGR